MSEKDVKNLPYYKQFKIEIIDFLRGLGHEPFQAFCQGNVIKYICRYKGKNGLEDLKKARVYLDWMIKDREKEEHELTSRASKDVGIG